VAVTDWPEEPGISVVAAKKERGKLKSPRYCKENRPALERFWQPGYAIMYDLNDAISWTLVIRPYA